MNDIEVQYFAVLRERAGTSRETVQTAAATAGELYDELAAPRRAMRCARSASPRKGRSQATTSHAASGCAAWAAAMPAIGPAPTAPSTMRGSAERSSSAWLARTDTNARVQCRATSWYAHSSCGRPW